MGKDFNRPIVARGAAYGDYDRDGDLDVAVTTNHGPAYLFRNDGGNRNNWLAVQTRGREVEPRRHRRRRPGGERRRAPVADGAQRIELCSQSELALTFGLGADVAASSIEVEWPSGARDRIDNVRARQFVTIEEGRGLKQ